MKRETILFLLLDVLGQNKSYITVRGSELNNGVVVLDIAREAKAYKLQCNYGAAGCTTLKNDKYLMVELPENFGMYECKCVDVYPENTVDPQKDKDTKLGEYCLIEK